MGDKQMKELYTFEEAAEALGVSRATMNRRLADLRNFPHAYKTGPGRTAHWRIPAADIEAFKQRHTRESAREAGSKAGKEIGAAMIEGISSGIESDPTLEAE